MTLPPVLRDRMRVGRPVALRLVEASEHANVSVWTLRGAISRGELKAWRRGRTLRVLDRDLDAWLLDRDGSSFAPIPSDATASHGSAPSSEEESGDGRRGGPPLPHPAGTTSAQPVHGAPPSARVAPRFVPRLRGPAGRDSQEGGSRDR